MSNLLARTIISALLLLVIPTILFSQNEPKKISFYDAINSISFYKDYHTKDYLTEEDLYNKLVTYDTIDRSHYHEESLLNFNILNSGYDEPYRVNTYFSYIPYLKDSSFNVVLEWNYNNDEVYLVDTAFLVANYYETSFEDSLYLSLDSVLQNGLYKMISLKNEGEDITERYCIQNRYLLILPDNNFVQYYDNYSNYCFKKNQNAHNERIFTLMNYVTLSGKFHFSRGGYLYLFTHENKLIDRLKTIKYNADRLIFLNDGGLEFKFKRDK